MDATKERILAAAQQILKQRGAEALTMDTTADLAGMSRKTIYNHFRNRFELIDAAVAHWMQSVLNHVQEIASDAHLPFIEKLNRVVEQGFHQLRDGGRIMGRPQQEFWDPQEVQVRKNLQESLEHLIRSIVDDSAAAGYIRKEFTPHQITWIIITIITGITVVNAEDLEGRGLTRADLLQESLRAVVLGVLTPEGYDAMKHCALLAATTGGPSVTMESPVSAVNSAMRVSAAKS